MELLEDIKDLHRLEVKIRWELQSISKQIVQFILENPIQLYSGILNELQDCCDVESVEFEKKLEFL